MVDMDMLSLAIQIATKAHKGQVDKAGKSYILHPLRVMLKGNTLEEQIVGVLHDVIEDTSITSYDLEKDFPKEIMEALILLTHEKKIPYMEYIELISKNKLATKVKLNDLEDNSDVARLKTITEKDVERIKKYYKASSYLINSL